MKTSTAVSQWFAAGRSYYSDGPIFYIISFSITSLCPCVWYKTYRQIRSYEDDTPLQWSFWCCSEDELVKICELPFLPFDLNFAPYLSTRCLQALADEIRNQNSKVKKVLIYDFYIDNALSGADSIHEALNLNLQVDLISVLKTTDFELGKWCTNHPDLLKPLPEEMIKNQFPF